MRKGREEREEEERNRSLMEGLTQGEQEREERREGGEREETCRVISTCWSLWLCEEVSMSDDI